MTDPTALIAELRGFAEGSTSARASLMRDAADAIEALLGAAPLEGALPHIWVQWKATTACFDFWCECVSEDSQGDFGHGDVDYAYAVQCARCGRRYDLPQTLPLLPFSGKFEAAVVDGFGS
ncbi:hypothetical protein [Microbacterium sp. zg-YB36]|uniref:hypothetical protein n=1 Tax=Microbacterium sp. zg-YB36 TaxID=2969407 RepID=UPI00214C2673|nr:hypothetical protein [Microbacterium sp. zg-YB36]MDL5351182.1 hypothetical protein [Microbacterium sp. zg-YB36]